jgi:transcriptional regulator with XRE-family HTH domain
VSKRAAHSTYSFQKPKALPEGAPRDAVKIEFARRLQAAMVEKGWNQSELARQAAKFTGDGKFPRDNVSSYCRGLSLPGPNHLHALSQALRKTPTDLVPSRGVPTIEDRLPPLDVRDVGDGMAWLKINQSVPWSTALKIMEMLKGEGGDD